MCIWHTALENLIPNSFDKTLVFSGLDNKIPENDEFHIETNEHSAFEFKINLQGPSVFDAATFF